MSGIHILLMMSADSVVTPPPPPPPPPLNISLTSSYSVSTPLNVSGSSGSATILNYTPSGGGGGYTVSAGAANMGTNPSGKLSQGNPSNPSGSGTITISWTGFVINEVEYAVFGCSVTSGASFASAGLQIAVKRTS